MKKMILNPDVVDEYDEHYTTQLPAPLSRPDHDKEDSRQAQG
jgi:hypothetical protein